MAYSITYENQCFFLYSAWLIGFKILNISNKLRLRFMMNCYLKFSHTISSFYSSFSFKHDLYVIPTMIYEL